MRISSSQQRKFRQYNQRTWRARSLSRKKIVFRSKTRYEFVQKRKCVNLTQNHISEVSRLDRAKEVVYMVILSIYNYLNKLVQLPGSIGRNKQITYKSNDKITYSTNFCKFVFNRYAYLSRLGGLLFATGMNSEAAGNDTPGANYWIYKVSLDASSEDVTNEVQVPNSFTYAKTQYCLGFRDKFSC